MLALPHYSDVREYQLLKKFIHQCVGSSEIILVENGGMIESRQYERIPITWNDFTIYIRRCALAPRSFSHDVSILRMLSSFYDRGPFYDLPDSARQEHPTARMVVISDCFGFVDRLRRMGLQAWQLSPFSATSEWSIQGDLWESPIRCGAIHLAWHVEPVRCATELLQVMWMVRELGFMIVKLPDGGHSLMQRAGFHKVSFEWWDYEIWRRSA